MTHTADPAHAGLRQAPLGALCERMLRLGEASLNINESLEFDSVLQVVVDSARELTGARFGGLSVIDESGRHEALVTSGMTAEQHRLLTEMPGGLEFFEHLGRLNEPLGVADLAAYFASQGLREFRSSFEFGPCLVEPVRSSRETVGCIYLTRPATGPEFSDEDAAVLAMFASQAALVIANARRYRDEQRARADLETLIDTSPVGVLVFDLPQGDPVRANREALRIVGDLHGPDEPPVRLLKMMTVRRADGREVSLAERPLAQALAAGETVRAERIELARADGRSLTVLVNATPILSTGGDVESMVVTMQDMTPLEELDRMRADFLGLVSEEMRAPLVAVKGSAATLLESLPVLDPAETAQLVRIIESQADRMRGLIGELLDAAQIETGTLAVALEPTEVARLIDEAASALANSSIDVTIDVAAGLPLVMADRRRIVGVLHTIVSVAARRSDASTPTRISAEREGGHVRFSVQDPGRATPGEHLADLFKRMPRFPSDGGAHRIHRSGLGLAVCEGTVEAHGGRIWADHDGAGEGTRWAFTLPVAQHTAHAPLSSTRPRQPQDQAIRIAVIEHDPLTQRYINDTLSKAGYHVTVAADIHQALALPAADTPDLVLASLAAPGADGVELMSVLRARSDVPVILVAGYGQDEATQGALEAGAADYIVKPFSPTELVARTRAALHQHTAPQPADTREPFSVGELTIDYAARTVTVAGRPVPLSRTEHQLLCELSLNAGRALSHDQLMRRVWQSNSPAAPGIVRSAIKRLRRKLGDSATDASYIITVPHMGYRIGTPTTTTAPHQHMPH